MATALTEALKAFGGFTPLSATGVTTVRFREAARAVGSSASTLSEAVRWLETRLIERLAPALGEVESALDVVNLFRDRPAGTLRLNVPVKPRGRAVGRGSDPFLHTP